jgi:MFS transporter (putative signal transducer)
MNLVATTGGRKALFAVLYLAEGAPIGFVWWALPTRLRAAGVPAADVAEALAILALPWAGKFLWAPLVDRLASRRFPLRSWIACAQAAMVATIVPILFLDFAADFAVLRAILVLHAFCAATQDAAIDALCIATTPPEQRAAVSGWMQAGMLTGRAAFGGGALAVASRHGDAAAVVPLAALVLATIAFLLATVPREAGLAAARPADDAGFRVALLRVLRSRVTWLALAFALVAGVGFESVGLSAGPFLFDSGYSEDAIAAFLGLVAVGGMAAGALAGGRLATRVGAARGVVAAHLALTLAILVVAGTRSIVALGAVYLFIGLFTATSYGLLMSATRPGLAATQFSAYMGATNACESWSAFATSRLLPAFGYGGAFAALALASLAALPLVRPLAKGACKDGDCSI